MPPVEFNEPTSQIRRPVRPSAFARLALASGLAKTERDVPRVLLIAAALATALAVAIFAFGRVTPAQDLPITEPGESAFGSE